MLGLRERLKSVLAPSSSFMRLDEPLWRHTTFRIGGPVQFFLQPRSPSELTAALRLIRSAQMAWRVLGGGSNLLVSDRGLRGAVVSLAHMQPVCLTRSGERLRVSAQVPMGQVIRKAAKWGLSGLEPLCGLPGTVGGAVRMNAGAGGMTIGERVHRLQLLHADGRIEAVSGREIGWRYRQADLPPNTVVLLVEFALAQGDSKRIRQAQNRFLTAKRTTQPLSWPSAGCVFRNPADAFAGELIERSGGKGTRIGGAMVSKKHANFIVNTGRANAEDVRQLIRHVQSVVRHETGYRLQTEIHEWLDGRQIWNS